MKSRFTQHLIIYSILAILFSLSVYGTGTGTEIAGTFTTANIAPPDTIIVGIMHDDTGCGGTPLWDKTNNDTHMDYRYGPVLNWTEGVDTNGDAVGTRICIGTATDAYYADIDGDGNTSTVCDVLNFWSNGSAVAAQFTNLTNTTFVAAGTNKTYYVLFRSLDDGVPAMSGSSMRYTINILNTAPGTSSTFIAASTTAAKTHINTTAEVYKWTDLATDADDGSAANKCPADTLTHNASVGTSDLDKTYFGGAVAAPSTTGFSLTAGIPWGTTVVANTVNVTVYANFGACDQYGLCEAGVGETFVLYNTLPVEPTAWNMTNTHDPTPMVGWTNATDVDGDNITYYIRASLVSSGPDDLLITKNTSKPGDSTFWDTTISWGTDNATDGYANDTVYVRVWATDNITKNLNRTTANNSWFVLGDYLPDVTAVYITDSAGYGACPACTINPKSGTNASNIAIQVNWTELDSDCDSAGNARAKIYLCAYTLATDACDEGKYNYTWLFQTAGREGTNCWVNFSVNRTATDGTPPFWVINSTEASKYALWVNASDQAAPRKAVADNEANTSWLYARLASANFTDAVSVGGGTGIIMDTWNNGTTGYLMTNFGNDVLNMSWNASDATSPSDTWTVNGTNFEIDDDNEHIDEDSGAILAQNLTRPPLTDFFPSGGLDRCLSDACSSAAADETLVLYWHIAPTGLGAGTFRSNMTYYVNTYGS